MGTNRKGLPLEITESDWFKNLPVITWKGMLEDHRERLEEVGVDLDSLDKKYLAFVATLMSSWEFFETILSLDKIFEHLDEAWQRYERGFERGFGSMSRNAESAVKELKEAHYPDE